MNKKQIRKVFDDYTNETSYRLEETGIVNCEYRLALNSICKRPELRPLLSGITFEISDDINNLIYLFKPKYIRISHSLLNKPILAAFYLRFTLELSIVISQMTSDNNNEKYFISTISALHTVMFYLDGMITQEKDSVYKELPEWICELSTRTFSISDFDSYAEEFVEIIFPNLISLVPFTLNIFAEFQVKKPDLSSLPDYMEKIKNILSISIPTEKLLVQCGDTRMLINSDNGLNQYGCSSRPRPWAITFSSCTSSSVSDYAFLSAEKLRQRLINNALSEDLSDCYNVEMNRLRTELTTQLQLDKLSGTELIFTPSGTDAEYYALHLAIGCSDQPILNILISKTEVGSGTAFAAGGRYFDKLTPLGSEHVPGDPLDGYLVDDIEVSVLAIRDADGHIPSSKVLDNQVKELVENAILSNKRVLLHLLDCSKTGIGGPSLEIARQLKLSYPDKLEVLVDAAQFRLGRDALHYYLESGFMVLITGSKFFTGPPFSGALIIPPKISANVSHMPALPNGLRDYATKAELPANWQKFDQNLTNRHNLGLLLRWQAALWEISAFYSVEPQDQFNTIEKFGQHIINFIDENPDLQLVMAPPHKRGDHLNESSWDQLPTIFTFYIQFTDACSGNKRVLTYDEARFAYHCINTDISRFLPANAFDRELELAEKRCHIGQPVRMLKENNEWIAALRIAAGARLVSGVQYDHSLGDNPASRIEMEVQTAKIIFNKLSVIVKYWDDLNKYDLSCGADKSTGFYQF